MAGLYIRGIEIPKYGHRISILSNGHAYYEDYANPYVDLGEVIAVPDHGDLIDRQELEAKMKTRSWYVGRASDPDCLVADAPTVIPGGKGGDNEAAD